MISLLILLLLCAVFAIFDMRHAYHEECFPSVIKKALKDTRKVNRDAQIISLFCYMFRFGFVWILCFILSVAMMAYAGYLPTLGILAIKSALPIDKYFPWYAYLPLIPVSLIGALFFTFNIHDKGILYKRILWWLFPAGLTCWFLSGLGLTIREPSDSGMGDMVLVIVSLPLFGAGFVLAYVGTELLCWVYIWGKGYHFSEKK